MSKFVGIVDYGVSGNLESIYRAVSLTGEKVKVINAAKDLKKASHIILPGVGSFPDAMNSLSKSGLLEELTYQLDYKPTLGICLGMQILGRLGFEYETTRGIGFFNAEVKPIICEKTVPHMGFNEIEVSAENPVLKDLDKKKFYFMHSFEVVNYTDVAALTTYAEHKIVAAISKGLVTGVQFHPEKSREQGIKLFENFVSY